MVYVGGLAPRVVSQSKVYGLCLVWLQAVPRSTDVRRLARQQRVRAYFYGLDNSLSPSLTTLSFDDVELFRIGGDIVRGQWVNEGCAPPTDRVCVCVCVCVRANQLDDDMVRPIGSESVLDPVRVVPISPEPKLEHFVAAVSCATSAEQVNRANTAGFIVMYVSVAWLVGSQYLTVTLHGQPSG